MITDTGLVLLGVWIWVAACFHTEHVKAEGCMFSLVVVSVLSLVYLFF